MSYILSTNFIEVFLMILEKRTDYAKNSINWLVIVMEKVDLCL